MSMAETDAATLADTDAFVEAVTEAELVVGG